MRCAEADGKRRVSVSNGLQPLPRISWTVPHPRAILLALWTTSDGSLDRAEPRTLPSEGPSSSGSPTRWRVHGLFDYERDCKQVRRVGLIPPEGIGSDSPSS